MFKNSKQMVPIALRMLFARNDQCHNYNIRQSRSLHPSVGRGEAIYRSFSFHGVNIIYGTIYQNIFQLMYPMIVLKY